MNPNDFLNKLSTHVRNAIATGISLASSMQNESVFPIHLLAGLLRQKGSIAADILGKAKIDEKTLDAFLAAIPQLRPPKAERGIVATATLPDLDADSKHILEKAILVAYEHGHNYVGTEHLLFGLVDAQDEIVEAFFYESKINPEDIMQHLEISLQGTSNFPEMDDIAEVMDQIQQLNAKADRVEKKSKQIEKKMKKITKPRQRTALETFSTNLTDKYTQQKIDPVIGREEEIERIINILCRRTKNNPVLVGEPGVGKTAIVEGLAKRIVEGNVPDILKRQKILSLDLTLMIAGTIYRGEFEARLKQVIEEAQHHPDCILFIDELHNIIGAGSNQGAMDAANILKPALARGDLRCIGATTLDEYKKYISNDPALERRFQSIEVDEPSKEETKKILQGVKGLYEKFHNTRITHKAIDTAVDLSSRYIHDSYLPDKAIDLIDEASASVRVTMKPTALQEKIFGFVDTYNDYLDKKEEAIEQEDFDAASKWKEKAEKTEKKVLTAEKQLKKEKKPPRKKVTEKEVAKILGKRLGIDQKVLLSNEWEKLDSVKEKLKNHIVGQDLVIEKIIQTLRQAHLGFRNEKQPFASMLFVGPSGVGKTTLAKALAEELYHTDKALIRLDMSEFAESHGISKILGSPAGYVGHNTRNRFAENIKKRPYSVVLFDEIDKAHPDVQKLLLQILDEGTLTDSQGKKIHFNHSILILTTNTGAELFRSNGIGFGSSKDKTDKNSVKELEDSVKHKLKQDLGTALMSRLQTNCVFSPLSHEHVEVIIDKQLSKISEHILETKKLNITSDKNLVKTLAKETFNEDTGARHIDTFVNNIVHELIVEVLQKKGVGKKDFSLKKVEGDYVLV